MTQRSGDPARDAPLVVDIQAFDPGPSVLAAADALDAAGESYALIGGLALDAWGIPRATKDVDFAVPLGVAESVAERIRGPSSEVRPLRIGGVGLRDESRNLRIDLIDRRFHFSALFSDAIREANESGRRGRVLDREIALVSLEHLLAMKLVSGAPKDDIDARRILGLVRLDYARARQLVETYLGAASANRLDELARERGRPEVRVRNLYANGDDGEE